MLANLACAIADGGEVISDFRVLADQKELFGQVASVPTTWRMLSEIAAGGSGVLTRIGGAVHDARRRVWAAAGARHGGLPGVRIAGKVLEGVVRIRLDATATPAHSGKEWAEPNFKGFGHHPLLAYCDNTGEPLAAMMRRGGAGANTVADHLRVLEDSIAALPLEHRRQLMVSCDGAGASHGLINRLDVLASRPGSQLTYSAGRDLGARERAAITRVPESAWQVAIDHHGEVRERLAEDACQNSGRAAARCWRDAAHVTELTGLLREGPGGDQLAGKTGIFLGERYRRIAKRRGKKRAIVAVGRSILVIVWHLLSDPQARFTDLGSDHYDNRIGPERKKRNHIRQLEALGYKVTLEPTA